jgi:hypothetical protein
VTGGAVRPIPPGTLGFDCNFPLTDNSARWFQNLGYRFVLRYIPRRPVSPADLSVKEIFSIHHAGLGLMPVQHVEPQPWSPCRSLGREYGETAAHACIKLGLPALVNVWLDLENVKPRNSVSDTIEYCNAWFDAVLAAGFTPGIYVGWHSGLSASILYHKLAFEHYWAAYNLNQDEYPVVRGVQMKQRPAGPKDIPKGMDVEIDKNIVQADKLGGLPLVYAPDEWDTSPRSGSLGAAK